MTQDRTWAPKVEPGVVAEIETLAVSSRSSSDEPASCTGMTVL